MCLRMPPTKRRGSRLSVAAIPSVYRSERSSWAVRHNLASSRMRAAGSVSATGTGEADEGEPVPAERILWCPDADGQRHAELVDRGGVALVVAPEPTRHAGDEPVVDLPARRGRCPFQIVQLHLGDLEVPQPLLAAA